MLKTVLPAVIAIAVTPSALALSFNLTDVTPSGMSAAALAGFQQAASIWEATVTDNVEINLLIRFDGNDIAGDPLGGSTLGSAGSSTGFASYDTFRNALILDNSGSATDITAVANLPAGSSLSFLTNDFSTSAVITDNDSSNNNNLLRVNTANAKALGLLAFNDPANDAGIAFNSAFSWDFDQTDGVGAGLQDFVGVTVHEIGHALGFVSGVDIVDYYHGTGAGGPLDLNASAVHSVLDLFRYSAAGQLNYATGGAPYFSIDGGITNLGGFSTGAYNGDGRQASHWKDNQGLGIMDPTANPPGNINTLSTLDLQAFDAIGWNLSVAVPEPSTGALLIGTALLGLGYKRRA